jgi:hypothetical protein
VDLRLFETGEIENKTDQFYSFDNVYDRYYPQIRIPGIRILRGHHPPCFFHTFLSSHYSQENLSKKSKSPCRPATPHVSPRPPAITSNPY